MMIVNTSNIWRESYWSSLSLSIATLSHLLRLERISLGPQKAADLMQHLSCFVSSSSLNCKLYDS
jgi:hypothetical protein